MIGSLASLTGRSGKDAYLNCAPRRRSMLYAYWLCAQPVLLGSQTPRRSCQSASILRRRTYSITSRSWADILVTKKVDERLVTLGLFEQVPGGFSHRFSATIMRKNTVFIRQTLASFSPGEDRCDFQRDTRCAEQDKGRVFEGMVRSLAQQKENRHTEECARI